MRIKLVKVCESVFPFNGFKANKNHVRNDITCFFAIKLVYRIDLRYFKVFPFIFAQNCTTFKHTFCEQVLLDKMDCTIHCTNKL